MEVVNHRLVEGGFVTPYVKAAHSWGVIPPTAIIIHYTAGPSGQATVNLFANPQNATSAHIVAHEDGKITQMVDFNKMAAHAGESAWGGMKSFNNFSIGIEISNPGYLVKNPKGAGFVTWWEANRPQPKPVADDMVVQGKHRNAITTMTYWCKYPQAQIDSVFAVCEAICKAYPIKWILGHEEIAPGRKTDPGPAFPLDDLRAKILSGTAQPTTQQAAAVTTPKAQAPTGKVGVTTALVNIRSAADPKSATVTNPIAAGTKVEIIGESGDWYNVLHQITGWIRWEQFADNETNDDHDGEVVEDDLPIRTEPNDAAKTVAEPLKKGTKVFELLQKDGWGQVTTKVVGFVSKNFVKV